MTTPTNQLEEALIRIRDTAKGHPAFDEDCFERRDYQSLAIKGGDICDWTEIAIIADIALETLT